ncbi:hypothetical protein PYV61_25220, partial [Roseisolibacter sp. H3M3-2]
MAPLSGPEQALLQYLTVTGLLALVALGAPSLVILGLFLGILPGFVLGLAPTAFLWGATFAAAWWPAHGALGDWPAAALAGVLTYGAMRAIPAALDRPVRARLAGLRAGDVTPAARIAVRGTLAVELSHPSESPTKDVSRAWNDRRARARAARRPLGDDEAPRGCDALVAAALFTAGVGEVVRLHVP